MTIEQVREKIDELLRSEMVTMGIDIDDAKTGQMWAYDSERLSKRIIAIPELLIKDDDQSFPKPPVDEPFSMDGRHTKRVILQTQQDMLSEHWVKVKEKSNASPQNR